MGRFIWHVGEPPKEMKVRQVYAIAFDEFGRVLIKRDTINGKQYYGMFGGKPEKKDRDRIDTLRREFLEEANTTLKDPIYLVGYQEVEGDGDLPNYAQLRMVAMIDEIKEKTPDQDGGKIHDRILLSPQKAIERLHWTGGKEQIEEACKIAKEKFGLKATRFDEESV